MIYLYLDTTMRTVRISWKKVLPLVLVLIFLLYLLLPTISGWVSFSSSTPKVERTNNLLRPVFRSDKTPGNYEVVVENRMGPGENGKAHFVTQQHKAEEARFKSKANHFFNLFLF